ncbi:MAG: hypothetical protein HQL49_05135 [Gammaproteobacteria bacterium]|nr:hypothetical protein [Gammaproteobacteria bacterium]
MSQLHCYVADELAQQFQKRAEAQHLSVSKYLAQLVQREVSAGWPENYFSQLVVLRDEPLQRFEQGGFESRVELK